MADIGAGTGYFTRRFAAVVGPQGKAIGLDIESAMVTHINAEAQKQGLTNLSARQVSPNDPQLAPQSVDVVFICDTYHHMQERVAYSRLLAQALKPGGRVVIVDFQKRPLPLGPPQVRGGVLSQNIAVCVKLGLIAAFLLYALLKLSSPLWQGGPVITPGESAPPPFSFSAFAVTLMWISLSYGIRLWPRLRGQWRYTLRL